MTRAMEKSKDGQAACHIDCKFHAKLIYHEKRNKIVINPVTQTTAHIIM